MSYCATNLGGKFGIAKWVRLIFFKPKFYRQNRKISKYHLMMMLKKAKREFKVERKLTPYQLSIRPWMKDFETQ